MACELSAGVNPREMHSVVTNYHLQKGDSVQVLFLEIHSENLSAVLISEFIFLSCLTRYYRQRSDHSEPPPLLRLS